MRVPNLRLAALAAAGALILGGCAYGYDPYSGGYGGLSVGYGSYGYNDYGYYDPYYYGGFGYPYGGYGAYGGYGGLGNYGSPFGWYDNYYYPGTGIYVYDRYRTRHVWSDRQRSYWSDRNHRWHDHHGSAGTTVSTSVAPPENWSGFDRSSWRNRGSTSGLTASNYSRSSSDGVTSARSSGRIRGETGDSREGRRGHHDEQ